MSQGVNEEQLSAFGKVGAKYGAKFGKKAAQSETGRAAGRAALKAGTDAAVEDVNQRYLGKAPSEEAPSQPKTSPTQPKTSPTPKPVQTSKSSTSTRAPTQSRPSSQSHTSSSSPSYRRPSHSKPSSSSKKDSSKGSWNVFKKKESTPIKSAPIQRRPITKHAITHSGEWDKSVYCKALYDFHGDMPCDLRFNKGQRITIVTRTETQDDWWEGTVNGKTGIFPANYVSL